MHFAKCIHLIVKYLIIIIVTYDKKTFSKILFSLHDHVTEWALMVFFYKTVLQYKHIHYTYYTDSARERTCVAPEFSLF